MDNTNPFNTNIPAENNQGLTTKQEEEIREIIAASLANWTGITRFRTIESTITTIADFTNSQHNHSNAAGGGQLSGSNCFSAVVTVPNGGTGVNTLTSGAVLLGAGAGTVTTQAPLSASAKVYYVADSSGGAVTRKLTFTNGILTAEV